MTKKQIRETETIYLSDLEGTLEEVMTKLQNWKNEGWEGLEWNSHYESNDLYRNRLETDAEYNLRMHQEQLMKERAKAQRRKQYEQLKKEFGYTP